MLTRSLDRPALALIAVLLTGTVCSAEIQAAKNVKSTTQRQFVQARLEFNRRTMVDAYKQVGVRDPKWDPQAERFLEMMAASLANSGANEWSRTGKLPPMQEVLAIGQAARDAGCTDPLVLYMVATALRDCDREAEAREVFIQAYQPMIDSAYPAYRKAFAATRYIQNTPNAKPAEKARREEALKAREDLLLQIADAAGLTPETRRIHFDGIWDTMEPRKLEEKKAFYEALKGRPGADPWIVAMVGGEYFIDAGWAARGGGWASEVTEDGWKKFAEHLADAQKSLSQAWKLDPTLPEAPSKMITVAMAGHAAQGETEPLWFDRATAAQFDYWPAYSSMFWALRPRWGGSHEAMLAFGRECLATARFDTAIPNSMLTAIEDVGEDRGGDWDFLEREDVLADVLAVHQGYAEILAEDSTERPALTSRCVALAWRGGHYKAAERLLDRIEEPATPLSRHFTKLGGNMAEAIDEIRLMSGPHATEARRILALEADGETDKAQAAWRALAAKMEPGALGGTLVRGRLAKADQQLALAKDKTLSLPGDLAAFEQVSGQWTADADGWITGKSSRDEAALLLIRPELGRRYELTGKYEVLTPEDNPTRHAMLMVGYLQGQQHYACLLDQVSGQAVMRCGYDHRHPKAKGFGAAGTFRVVVYDGRVDVTIDDKHVVEKYLMSHGVDTADKRAGVGALAEPGHVVRYRDLAVKVLNERPK